MPLMGRMLIAGLTGLFWATIVMAQDTLPEFSASAHSNGKVVISWHNNYTNTTQISIQQSSDSLKNFTTFLTVQHPMLPENGFATNKIPGPGLFYRFFIVFNDDKYIFSRSRRAVPQTISSSTLQAKAPVVTPVPPVKSPAGNPPAPQEENLAKGESQRILFAPDNENIEKPKIKGPAAISKRPGTGAEKPIFFKTGDSTMVRLTGIQILKFRDSILTRTKDTLVFVNADTILVKRFVPKEVYKVSAYVFIGKEGNVYVSLPEAGKRSYIVKFLEENNRPLFELKDVKDPALIIDKTNFIHAGWYRFELFEDGKLKEKNKLLIPKNF